MTMPYANCKGILVGRLTMELGGKITIICEKTRYSADIEFKLKVQKNNLNTFFRNNFHLFEAIYWRSRLDKFYRRKNST